MFLKVSLNFIVALYKPVGWTVTSLNKTNVTLITLRIHKCALYDLWNIIQYMCFESYFYLKTRVLPLSQTALTSNIRALT